jgi:hypothetical protein
MSTGEPLCLVIEALHPRVAAVLQRVRAAEQTASGPQRRATFRLMRELLGAARRLNVPLHLLAECLEISPDSVRSRASGLDGTMTDELIERLTDLAPERLQQLSGGQLVHASKGGDPAIGHRTTDVLRALMAIPAEAYPSSPQARARAGHLKDSRRDERTPVRELASGADYAVTRAGGATSSMAGAQQQVSYPIGIVDKR